MGRRSGRTVQTRLAKAGHLERRLAANVDPNHALASQELFRRALESGAIYKGTYDGWYCPNCNNYYTDEDLSDGKCPEHGIKPEWLQEENYFFALSKFTGQLLALFEDKPDFVVPTSWRAETLAMIQRGLRDFSVSRVVRGDSLGHPDSRRPRPRDLRLVRRADELRHRRRLSRRTRIASRTTGRPTST